VTTIAGRACLPEILAAFRSDNRYLSGGTGVGFKVRGGNWAANSMPP
jgi:hypothetical protein